MPVPTQATYSAAALTAAHTAFRDLLDAGPAGGSIKIRDGSDVLLAQIPLSDPCGTVNATTGQLTLTPAGRDEGADTTGVAAYGELCDSTGAVHLSLPATVGTLPVAGAIVLNTLAVTGGAPVEVLSATIG